MFILGITGGIGSGKSTVSSILRDRGLLVLDADEISKIVTDVGGSAIPAVMEAFGPRAIDSEGKMNRKYISNIVFKDKMKLDLLSSIVHKYVMDYLEQQCEKERTKGTKCVVLDVPIPVNRFINLCNQIWVVTCDEAVRVDRLVARGLDREDAKRRIFMQMTDDEYVSLGNYEINNSGDLSELEGKVEELILSQLHERGIRI